MSKRKRRIIAVFAATTLSAVLPVTANTLPESAAAPRHAQVDAAAPGLNVLVRGQSNALLFCDRGGAAELEAGLEARLGADVHLLYRWGEADSTIHSGSAFMTWDTDGKQAGLISHVNGLPAEVQDNPTLTLWMHNEYDQGDWTLTTADWTREVRADADLVRGALGQASGTTPYLFVPIRYPYGSNWQAVGDGMAELADDPSFHAGISWAAQGLVMDGDGHPDSSHMGDADALDLGRALVDPVAAMLAPLTGTPPAEPGAGWTLAYEDQFNGSQLNPGVWDAFQGISGHSKVRWVKDNVTVANGVVTLTVDTPANEAGAISTQTSDLVQPYGKYEVRARIDEGKGVGLAMLLWPQSQQWPRDGEIDFAEMPRRDRVHFTNHYEENGHQYETDSMWLDVTQWHTYGVEWTPGSISFLVDGVVRKVMTEHIPSGPMFLAMQTEYMGECTNGDWIPCPDETTPAIVRAQLDGVKIYQRSGSGSGAITGIGGKCVDVDGGDSADGTAVQLWTCNGTGAQQWTLPGDGTIRALGKCLDVQYAGTSDGTPTWLWACNGTGAQQWTPRPDGTLLNPQSGRCLDAAGNSSADGTVLHIWSCHNGDNQKWSLP